MSDNVITLKGSELVRILTNVSLWHDPNAVGGLAYMTFRQNLIEVFSSDGYVGALDSLEYESDTWTYATLALTEMDVDKIVMASREVKTKTIDIYIDPDTCKLHLPYDFSLGEKGATARSAPKLTLEEGESLVGEAIPSMPDWCLAIYDETLEPEVKSTSIFAMRPERWLKFSRVKADKDAPIDVAFLDPWNNKAPLMAAVRIGGTFRALVNLVERDKAKTALGDKAKEWMW